MLATGSVLQGRYSIEKVLGQGGMGSVYLAREVQLGGKRVAVKEMHVLIENPVDRQRAVEQFHREAQILANLEHPGLVDVTHYFEEADKQYLVMAFIDGITLESVLATAPNTLPVRQVLEWSDQLCDVLEYLHGQNPPIIFRDLKPSNIMLDVRGHIRLIDFGIARVFDAQSKTATFIKGAGTPGFAPVEQYGRGATDPRSDIYALGATVYTLLTRRVPPSSVDLMAGIDALVPASEFNAEITPSLDVGLLKMMAMKKEDRFQSIGEARKVLRQIASGTATTAGHALPEGPDVPVDTGRTVVQQRFCATCGTTVSPLATACGRCGQPLDSSTLVKEPELPVTLLAPTSPPIPVIPSSKPAGKTPLPMVAVVLLLGLGIAAWMLKPASAPTPIPSPIATVHEAPTSPAPPVARTVRVETPTLESVTVAPPPPEPSVPFTPSVEPARVVRDNCEAVASHDFERAYRLRSKRLQQKTTPQRLKDIYQDNVSYALVEAQPRERKNDSVQVAAVVRSTDREAGDIVTGDYPIEYSLVLESSEWKIDDVVPQPRRNVRRVTAAPTADIARQAVAARYASWKRAWEAMDLRTFLSFYDGSVVVRRKDQPSYGYSALESRMRDRWSQLHYIRINDGDLHLDVQGDRVTLTVWQHYDSDTWFDEGTKGLVWRFTRGGWFIVEEWFDMTSGGGK